MSGSEPAEEDIQNVVAIACIPRAEAVVKLKQNGNNVQRAIEALFDPPSIPTGPANADVWDDASFSVDRNGAWADAATSAPSFQVHTADSNYSAPSRPPSRVNNQDSIPITMNDHRNLSPSQQETDDYDQAMKNSLSDLGPQESGVVGDGLRPQFGPANQEYYDSDAWAMTRTQAAEIILPPEPSNRERKPGTPAFLKPHHSAYYLAQILTIFHSIPLARDVLLQPQHLLSDYGEDSEWWNGATINTPLVVDVDEGFLSADCDRAIYETQRLMAFLEMTNRAYGSVDGLADLDRLKGDNLQSDTDHERPIARYFELMRHATERIPQAEPSFTQTFFSKGVKVFGPAESLSKNEDTFARLEIDVGQRTVNAGKNLYDALDELIWESVIDNDDTSVYLESVGDIFTVRLRNITGSPGLGIKIPATWFPDRYLSESQALAKEMRSSKAAIDDELEYLYASHDDVSLAVCPDGERRPVLPILAATIAHFQAFPTLKRGAESGEVNADISSEPTSMETSSPINAPELVAQLEKTVSSIEAKQRSLNGQIEDARARLKDLSKLLTEESEDPSQPPHHKYTLRGVVTEQQYTYVLHPLSDEFDDYTPDARARGAQWWKIQFSSSISDPVNITKVPEVHVLKAAKEEHREVMLVYASERAQQEGEAGRIALALQNFVHNDNRLFKAEFPFADEPVSRFSITPDSTPPPEPTLTTWDQIQPIDADSSDGTLAAEPSGAPHFSSENRSHSDGWGNTPPGDAYSNGRDDLMANDEIQEHEHEDPTPVPSVTSKEKNVVGGIDQAIEDVDEDGERPVRFGENQQHSSGP
ncbi:MAG: hypothetical protein M1824_004088 [Vezdaea acicularis]|nr:MAG: hypothetical protein M1824_004088 [Vezdaea acicularis]